MAVNGSVHVYMCVKGSSSCPDFHICMREFAINQPSIGMGVGGMAQGRERSFPVWS